MTVGLTEERDIKYLAKLQNHPAHQIQQQAPAFYQSVLLCIEWELLQCVSEDHLAQVVVFELPIDGFLISISLIFACSLSFT